jgi:hypothetical protein
VIALLRDLSEVLAADDVTADAVVARLGGVPEDLGPNVLVERPALAGVARASVVRDGLVPAHVTLELAEPLAAETLAAAFGEPRRAYPDHPGEPVSLLFALPVAVTLIAAERAGAVRSLTLRRDVV